MKSLEIKLDSDHEFKCRLFELTLQDTENKTEKPAGIAFVICSFDIVVLILNKDITLTQDEENKLKQEISGMYKIAEEIGFAVDIHSKHIHIINEAGGKKYE